MQTSTGPLARALLGLAALAIATAALALEPGAQLPAFSLKDSAGNPRTLETTTRRIYASADRKGDALLKDSMRSNGQAMLDAQQAVVIADISQAPGFVKAIIRSSLKDRGYSTWLDSSGSTRGSIPYRPDAVTVIELDARRVTAIRFASDAGALARELAAPKP